MQLAFYLPRYRPSPHAGQTPTLVPTKAFAAVRDAIGLNTQDPFYITGDLVQYWESGDEIRVMEIRFEIDDVPAAEFETGLKAIADVVLENYPWLNRLNVRGEAGWSTSFTRS